MSYQAIGSIYAPGLQHAGRLFDSSSGGWTDGGGDAFDSWNGFKLTIGGATSALVTDAMMNDSTGVVSSQTLTIGGQSVSVSSMWHDRSHFCIQCRYSGSAVLSFGGGLGSNGAGVLSKDGLTGSHGGTSDPRIWWRIIPLLPTDSVDFTCVGSDPITITCSAMSEGFALLFGWAPVTHGDVVSLLGGVVATTQDKDMRWPGYAVIPHTPIGLCSGITWANQETREQAWPGEIAVKPATKQVPALLWRATEPVLPVDAKLTLGFIRGVTSLHGAPQVNKRVVCFDKSMLPVAECNTDASGEFRFDLLWKHRLYTIMAMDSGSFTYSPAAADRRQPESYS